MKLGISSACFYPMQTELALENIVANGIENIEIFINSTSEIEDAFVKQISQITKNTGAKFAAVHPFECPLEPMMFFTEYERRFYDSLEVYKKYFEFCAKIGAEVFVFHGDHKQSLFPDKEYYERFAILRDTAKEHGVIFAQENVARSKSHSIEFLRAMKEYLSGDVGFVLDTKQIIRSNENLYEYIDVLGENIAHVHISDYDDKNDCLPLGKGKLDVNKFICALKSKGFDSAIVIELYSNNYSTLTEVYNSVKIIKDYL